MTREKIPYFSLHEGSAICKYGYYQVYGAAILAKLHLPIHEIKITQITFAKICVIKKSDEQCLKIHDKNQFAHVIILLH